MKETSVKNGKISEAAGNLFPGYFALVMATGIISIAALSKLEPQPVDQPQQHLGQTYIRRAKSPQSKEALFYVTFDQTLVLSDQAALIRQAIEMQQAAVARAESESGKALDGRSRSIGGGASSKLTRPRSQAR